MILHKPIWLQDEDYKRYIPLPDLGIKKEDFQWEEAELDNWQPLVEITEKYIEVTFYSFSLLGTAAIYRHKDIYKKGTYEIVKEEMKHIATIPEMVMMF